MGPTATTDRLDVWRDVIREHFVALDIAAERRDGFSGAVRTSEVGHLAVSSVSSTAQGCTRTPQLARFDDDVYLQVGLVVRGTGTVRQDGREAVLSPGDFAVYETDRPFFWGFPSDWELFVFTWPRASVRVHDTTSHLLTARCLSGTDGLGAIVGRVLRDLVTSPPVLSAAGAVRLGDEVAELVTTVATEQAAPAGPERAADSLLRSIDAYIVERLHDPRLGPTEIAADHFISTRHLHRLFAGRGTTVTQTIQRWRLEGARQELVQPGCDARSITDISRRWGFQDLPTFSRAFRTTFGKTPTECRATRT